MSTETKEELDRISGNVADTYSVLEQFGAEMPQVRNTANLPETAAGIKAVLCIEQKLTEAQQMQARKNIGVPDTEEIVQQVISALGTPVFGTVDGENNIILTGNLADGTYILKYEDAEGNLTEIGTVVVGGAEEVYITFYKGKIDSSSGNITQGNSDYFYSDAVEISSGHTYTLHTVAGLNNQGKCCYWDANGSFLSSATVTLWNAPTTESDYEIPIPTGAASFRLRLYNNDYSKPDEALAGVNAGITLTMT